ncbi:hypothetical protein F5Y17DRAFT_216449 [Xylariaceae sp. FL0594]|nr:hypothetical protein F5Y17DRAFT_216449 [Xylariaceae sp. FL0594]
MLIYSLSFARRSTVFHFVIAFVAATTSTTSVLSPNSMSQTPCPNHCTASAIAIVTAIVIVIVTATPLSIPGPPPRPRPRPGREVELPRHPVLERSVFLVGHRLPTIDIAVSVGDLSGGRRRSFRIRHWGGSRHVLG